MGLSLRTEEETKVRREMRKLDRMRRKKAFFTASNTTAIKRGDCASLLCRCNVCQKGLWKCEDVISDFFCRWSVQSIQQNYHTHFRVCMFGTQ